MEAISKTKELRSKLYEEVVVFSEPTLLTNISTFDSWFSADKGIVQGSAIYVSGTSGAGKTTLMVNLMKWLSPSITSMYLREMEGRNVKYQTRNIEMPKGTAYFADINNCKDFGAYMEELELLQPKVVIVDSLQAIAKEDFPEMGENEACYYIIKTLREFCSRNNSTLFLIGHNTKDGNFAGGNTIIQMMDAHIVMEHDKKEDCRKIYWGQKNRKGPMGLLYYEFSKEGISFLSVDEYEAKNATEEDKSYLNFVINNTEMFIDKIDKNNPNRKLFVKEYKMGVKNIENIVDDAEYVSSYTKMVFELLFKFGLSF
jgi:predicted ATP-dependent serine protease